MQSTSSESSNASHAFNSGASRIDGTGSCAQRDMCSQGDVLHCIRNSLARHGAHGAVEFALQIRFAASPDDTIAFGDLARVVERFCGLGEACVHSIFRLMDKDCHGRIPIHHFIDVVYAQLSPAQMERSKSVYAACSCCMPSLAVKHGNPCVFTAETWVCNTCRNCISIWTAIWISVASCKL